jgi:two-component system, NarL family, response regulator LiaR
VILSIAILCYNAVVQNPNVPVTYNTGSQDLTTIMIADDHPLVRQALRGLLESQSDFKVVGEASDGEEAVDLAARLEPDVVIMDITMPKMNGLIATRKIKQQRPDTRVLVLTVHSDNEHIMGILEAGAAGYLTKSVFGKEVLSAVRSVMAGDSVLSNAVLHQLIKTVFQQQPDKTVDSSVGEILTSRELEILKLAARGLSNKDIAQKLNLSLQTVKGYSVSIFSKLRVGSRTEAVIFGLRSGLLTLKDLD